MGEKFNERERQRTSEKKKGEKKLQKQKMDNKLTVDVWQGSLYFIFILLSLLKRWVVILVAMRFETKLTLDVEKKNTLELLGCCTWVVVWCLF